MPAGGPRAAPAAYEEGPWHACTGPSGGVWKVRAPDSAPPDSAPSDSAPPSCSASRSRLPRLRAAAASLPSASGSLDSGCDGRSAAWLRLGQARRLGRAGDGRAHVHDDRGRARNDHDCDRCRRCSCLVGRHRRRGGGDEHAARHPRRRVDRSGPERAALGGVTGPQRRRVVALPRSLREQVRRAVVRHSRASRLG